MKKQLLWGMLMLATAGGAHAQNDTITLGGVLDRMAKGNRELQIKALKAISAQIAVKEAKSYRLPSVQLNGMYTIYGERPVIYLRNEQADPKVDDVKYGGRFAFDASVSVMYPLIQPGLRTNVKLMELVGKITELEKQELQQELALNASRLYLSILFNRKQENVLLQSLERNEQSLRDSRSLFMQGKNLKTDTLSNYISVQNIKASLVDLASQEKVMRTQLGQLMGMEEAMLHAPADSLLSHSPVFRSMEEALDEARRNRKELQSQLLVIEKQKLQVEHVDARYKPQLWAVGQYQVQSQADDFQLGQYAFARTSFAGVRLQVPIYSGQRHRHQRAQAQLSVRENELAMKEMTSTVYTEIISLYARLQNVLNQWKIQQQNVAAAQVSYQMMNDRYRMGMGTRLELTDAELALTRSMLTEVQIGYEVAMLEFELKKAVGSGF